MRIIFETNVRGKILEKEMLIEILQKNIESKTNLESKEIEVTPKPIQGKCFEVNPSNISKELFNEKRKDQEQEKTRKIILEALAMVEEQPEKYSHKFKTFIPECHWTKAKPVKELKKFASELGGHMANWVEQSLEWAQRIANGETWEEVCNNPDTLKWYRIIEWKDGNKRLIGSSCLEEKEYSATDIYYEQLFPNHMIYAAVPLVVLSSI